MKKILFILFLSIGASTMAFANASKKSSIIEKPFLTNTFKIKKENNSEWTCWYMSTQSGCVSGWFCG